MKTTNFQTYRTKANLMLTLPNNKIIINNVSDFREKQNNFLSSPSAKSTESLETQKSTFIEKYTILDTLGQGAHGVVKSCILKSKKQKYAVKITKLDEQISYLYRKNFLTMKCLHHENIVKYKALYLDQVKKISYLIMEFVPYPTLKGYRVQNEEQLKQITLQIVKALQYMHRKHICHRDLKTQNILYSKKDKKIKIVDFGICKKMTLKQEKSEMLTPTGTLAYKAPQMFEGEGYDEKIDIWALGVIMYQLVSGKNPFLSEYTSDTIKNIQTLEVNYSGTQWKCYQKVCKDLINHLLRKSRSQRLSIQQTRNHLFFEEISDDRMNLSHHYHRQKTQKKIAQGYIQSYIVPKTKNKERKVEIDDKKCQLFTLIDSEEESEGINIY